MPYKNVYEGIEEVGAVKMRSSFAKIVKTHVFLPGTKCQVFTHKTISAVVGGHRRRPGRRRFALECASALNYICLYLYQLGLIIALLQLFARVLLSEGQDWLCLSPIYI